MKIVLFLSAICMVYAKEKGNAHEARCKLPTKDDTDCKQLIVDCEDQLEEAHVNRGQKISCLDINTMNKEKFFEATESCNVLSQCKCTVAYYLHCKYDPDEFNFAPPPNESPCFSGDTMVDTSKGSMSMRDLFKQDNIDVKVINEANEIVYSPLQTWLHANEQETARFYTIKAGDRQVSLTAEHIIYSVPCEGGERSARFPKELQEGECLLTEQNGAMYPTPISSIETTTMNGIYSPLTEAGTVVANGFGASSFAGTKHEVMARYLYTMVSTMDSIFRKSGLQHMGTIGILGLQKGSI